MRTNSLILLIIKVDYYNQMSVYDISIENFKQDFSIKNNNKKLFGEVHTDFKLVTSILDLIPIKHFKDPNLKWLDPCAGRGYFSIILYKKLMKYLTEIKELKKRHHHILTNMIYCIEINKDFVTILKNLFGEKNIINEDFLFYNSDFMFDFIIGNPPYNYYSFKNECNHTSVWQSFIKKAFSLLKPAGHLVFITPSIWMKNTHPIFNYMCNYNIKKLHTLSKQETNRVFHGNAQVPSSYFCIENTLSKKPISIYDYSIKKYVTFKSNNGINNLSIPMTAISIINKLRFYVDKVGCVCGEKTNLRPERHKDLTILNNISPDCTYKNISTCKLNKQINKTVLIIEYSNKPCLFHNKPKIVFAHKMYGFPFLDKDASYGVSRRDNYVITAKTQKDLLRLFDFLNTNLWLVLSDAARYRQDYIDKQVFSFIPNIALLEDFPDSINIHTICDYFKFNDMERKYINNHKMSKWLNKF